jgi:hypothetical protein
MEKERPAASLKGCPDSDRDFFRSLGRRALPRVPELRGQDALATAGETPALRFFAATCDAVLLQTIGEIGF